LKSLWSGTTRRESSTEYTDNDEGLGINGPRHSERLYGKLQQMVEEAEAERARDCQQRPESGAASPEAMLITPEVRSPSMEQTKSPRPSRPVDIPLKMIVNQQDGVIDVELPFPDWNTPLHSPPLPGYHSASSVGSHGRGSSLISYGARDNDRPMNVAGMLSTLHPDFELQAVPPYTDLLDHIKAAMRAEPLPVTHRTFSDNQAVQEWIDVCTSLVTDTSSSTIKRIRLRRLVKFVPPPPPPPIQPGRPAYLIPKKSKQDTPNPYLVTETSTEPTQVLLEEKFEESKVTDIDSDLIFAIERVLSQSGTSSIAPSVSSSRSSSRRGRKSASDPLDTEDIPRNECKRLVVGALEQIATVVASEREMSKKYGGNRLRSLDDRYNSTLREGIRKWFDEVERKQAAIDRAERQKRKEEQATHDAEVRRKKREEEKAAESDDASTIRPGKRSTPTLPNEGAVSQGIVNEVAEKTRTEKEEVHFEKKAEEGSNRE
jgi:hypothetical protein